MLCLTVISFQGTNIILFRKIAKMLCKPITRFLNVFLMKGVFEQTLITATVINCKIILFLYDLNSTNQGYYLRSLTSWNAKISVYHLRYRYKQKTKNQNKNLDTRAFTLRYAFSVISKKIYSVKRCYC